MGQLGGQQEPVAVALGDEASDAFLVTGVGVGGVEVIDALLERRLHHGLRRRLVDDRAASAEAHAPETQHRETATRVPRFAILHGHGAPRLRRIPPAWPHQRSRFPHERAAAVFRKTV